MINVIRSDITGTVSFDGTNNIVQMSNVKYRFQIQGENMFQPQGKVLIVFPKDYQFSSTTNLQCHNLDDSNKRLDCSLNPIARLLVMNINSTTFIRQRTLQFTVSGITNPLYATETDPFLIQNYYTDSNNVQQYEPSSDKIRITPKAGSLTQFSLSLDDPTVGSLTSLSLTLTPEHSIPQNGLLLFRMPKWNSFAPSTTSPISFVQAQSSVSCTTVTGITSISCVLIQGTTEDLIQISTSGSSAIIGGTSIQIKIGNFRAPPRQGTYNGFRITTAGRIRSLIINEGSASLKVTKPAIMPSQSVRISQSTSVLINQQTTMTFEIRNLNPLPAGVSLRLIIPSDFQSSNAILTSVTGRGGSFQSLPQWSKVYDTSSKTITLSIQSINTQYSESSTYQYITLSRLLLPGTTKETQSFQFYILDPSGQVIEQITTGVTVKPVAGTISQVSVTPSITNINSQNVQYNFKLTPQEPFLGNRAKVKLTFPDQIQLNNRVNQRLVSVSPSTLLSLSSARVTVTQNKQAVITGLFIRDIQSPYQSIEFTIDGVTNPSSIQRTESFEVLIFYEDNGVEEISKLSNDITVTASPNNDLSFAINPLKLDTGANNQLQFVIQTGSLGVTKGSYLKIGIPSQLQIYDASLAASTCLKIQGFSDEIACELEISQFSFERHQLTIKSGFDSKSFSGGTFSFNISEIRNPKTTEETTDFILEIYDSSNNLQYRYNGFKQTLKMRPSPFQFAQVTSDSAVNGASSLYTFTMTLAVDTEVNSLIMVNVPPEIEYDQSRNFTCRGLLGLVGKRIKCEALRPGRVFTVGVWSDLQSQSYIQNGTSVSFELGYFFNPKSFEPSSSFALSTFVLSYSNTRYNYINQQDDGLIIQNSLKGQLSNFSTSLSPLDLGQPTRLTLKFTSPSSSSSLGGDQIVITIPPNVGIQTNQAIRVVFNNRSVESQYVREGRLIRVVKIGGQMMRNNEIRIEQGLSNPVNGSYKISGITIEVQNAKGYSIDYGVDDQGFTVNCTSNCQTCSNGLDKCTSCGQNQMLNQTFYLQGQQCLSTCPAGFYEDSSDFKCKPCSFPCQQCKYSATQCTLCFANHSLPFASLLTLSCFRDCPAGTYLNSRARQCQACNSPCFTCEGSASQCTSCALNTYYFSKQNQCLKSCPSGTLQTQQGQCVECSNNCKTCNEQPEQCTACQDGLYLYRQSQCIERCPQEYRGDDSKKECVLIGERAFPFPFTIIIIVCSLGLLIARKFKNQTQFTGAMLALTDLVMKINWIYLVIYLYADNHYISGIILSYCLFSNLLVNFFIFRIPFKKHNLLYDHAFSPYRLRYPKFLTFNLYISSLLSFQFIRLTTSRLLGLKSLSATFTNLSLLNRILTQTSFLSLIFVILPGAAACTYDLSQVQYLSHLWYFDIDGLLLIALEILLIFIIVRQDQGSHKSFSISEIVKDFKVLSNDTEEQTVVHNHQNDEQGDARSSRTVNEGESQRTMINEENIRKAIMLKENNTEDKVMQSERGGQNGRQSIVLKSLNTLRQGEELPPLIYTATRQSQLPIQTLATLDDPNDWRLFSNFKIVKTEDSGQSIELELEQQQEDQTYASIPFKNQESFEQILIHAISILQSQTEGGLKPLTLLDFHKVKAMLHQLQRISHQRKQACSMELNKKAQLLTLLDTLKGENQSLNAEEERLKRESEGIRDRIENFKKITKLELKENEMVKREQSRQRSRERQMRNAMREREDEEEAQRIEEVPQAPKRLVTYKQATLGQMMREGKIKNSKAEMNTVTKGSVGSSSKVAPEFGLNTQQVPSVHSRNQSSGIPSQGQKSFGNQQNLNQGNSRNSRFKMEAGSTNQDLQGRTAGEPDDIASLDWINRALNPNKTQSSLNQEPARHRPQAQSVGGGSQFSQYIAPPKQGSWVNSKPTNFQEPI